MMLLLALLSLLLVGAQPAAMEREGYFSADDDTRLFYRIEGAGPETLVVVHGGPGNSMESIRLDMAPLAQGRRVIYYDQRGNGRSDLVDGAADLAVERHVADLEALRRHFGLEQMTLLGNSWGGLLVSAYAAAHPDRVERLVLDAPAPPTLTELDGLNDEFERRARLRLNDAERSRLEFVARPDHWAQATDPVAHCREFARGILLLYRDDPQRELVIRGDLCAGPPEAVRRQLAVNRAIWRSLADFDLRPAVRRVNVPVLLITGESEAVPLSGLRRWGASYPDARLVIVPRAGHLVHLEQPDIFFPVVEQFLRGEWPAQAVPGGNQRER